MGLRDAELRTAELTHVSHMMHTLVTANRINLYVAGQNIVASHRAVEL